MLKAIGFNYDNYLLSLTNVRKNDQVLHFPKLNTLPCPAPRSNHREEPAFQKPPACPSHCPCESCHHRLILPVSDFHLNGINQQLLSGVCRFSLNIVFVRFTYVTSYVCGSQRLCILIYCFYGNKEGIRHHMFSIIRTGCCPGPPRQPGLPVTRAPPCS